MTTAAEAGFSKGLGPRARENVERLRMETSSVREDASIDVWLGEAQRMRYLLDGFLEPVRRHWASDAGHYEALRLLLDAQEQLDLALTYQPSAYRTWVDVVGRRVKIASGWVGRAFELLDGMAAAS